MDPEATLEDMLAFAHDVDVLLTEGYRRAGDVRIEVSRRARSTELVCDVSELFALVTDNDELGVMGIPVFGLDDAEGLADLVERTFLAGSTAGATRPKEHTYGD
jgi:molybdopterin-guanine dinucleotide biosynthesis protein B